MRAEEKLVGLACLASVLGLVSASFPFPMDRMEVGPLMRLNIQQSQLKQMCDSKLESLYKTIITSAEIIDKHLSVYYSESTQRCENDTEVKSKFEILLSMVQLCMNPKDRLTDSQQKIFIRKLLKVVCKMYSIDPRNSNQHRSVCTHVFIKHREMCWKNFNNIVNILLPLINNPQDCSELRKFFNCMDGATMPGKLCSAIKINMKSLNNITYYELNGCTEENPKDEASNDNEEIINIKPVHKESKLTRFSISKTELKEKCELRGNTFLKNLDSSLAESMVIAVRKQFKMTLTARLEDQTEKDQLHILVNENCYNDTEIKGAFENIFHAVQHCLDEDKRIDEEGKEKMLKESINIMCYGMESSLWLIPNDRNCFHDFGIFFKKAMCNKQISSEKVYGNLPLPFVSTPKECNNLYQMQNCELDIFKECYDSTKIELKKQYNLLRKLSGCDDMYNTLLE